jgi:UDP-N-acetylglucosamine 2-epimerase (non-hydrolysing)
MRIAVVIGTRPEAIKLCPVVLALRRFSEIEAVVVSTGQHREMLGPILSHFQVQPHFDLGLMLPDQTLSGLMSRALDRLDALFAGLMPATVVVQGDTTTAVSAALAAFHRKIPVAHVEAGLRTHDLAAPFPEEANRSLIARIARWNYAPTEKAAEALKAERVPGEIVWTGNTVVDALLQVAVAVGEPQTVLTRDRLVLITGHRRENLGERFREAFRAIGRLADAYPDVDFVYPVHMNPRVREHAHELLGDRANLQLLPPVAYPELVALLKRACLVLTDSGGIQEEAPSFGVPVLIMRDKTERAEAVEVGVAQLVGTRGDAIFERTSQLLDEPASRAAIAPIENPFGDGKAASRIALHLHRAILARQEVANTPAVSPICDDKAPPIAHCRCGSPARMTVDRRRAAQRINALASSFRPDGSAASDGGG